MSLAAEEESIRLRVEDAAARLELLLAGVWQYVRKQDCHYREEARLASEQAVLVEENPG